MSSRWPQLLALVIGLAVAGPAVFAQLFTESVPDEDIGRPPRPPFITLLGIVLGFEEINSPERIPPRGSIAEVTVEVLRAQPSPAGPAGEVTQLTIAKYDDQDRVVEQIERQSGIETDTVSRYQGARLVSQETTTSGSRVPRPKFWNYWTYDANGKLMEFKRGSGEVMQNHLSNFKRDEKGRLSSYEYRQGASDELFSYTEFRFSADGKTCEVITKDKAGEVSRSVRQTVDDNQRVRQAVIQQFDWKTKKPKSPINVYFRYDEKGRLIEQKTEDPDFTPAGSENEMPPGTVSIVYDDVEHSKKTTYASKEGTLAAKVLYDIAGSAISVTVDAPRQSLVNRLECTYDDHTNWTSCQQISSLAGVRQVKNAWRRAIVYR